MVWEQQLDHSTRESSTVTQGFPRGTSELGGPQLLRNTNGLFSELPTQEYRRLQITTSNGNKLRKKNFGPIHSSVVTLKRMSMCQGTNWIVSESETDQEVSIARDE